MYVHVQNYNIKTSPTLPLNALYIPNVVNKILDHRATVKNLGLCNFEFSSTIWLKLNIFPAPVPACLNFLIFFSFKVKTCVTHSHFHLKSQSPTCRVPADKIKCHDCLC